MTDLNKLRSEFEAWFTTTDVYKRISHQIEMCGSGRHQDISTVFQRDDWNEDNYAQVSVMASWLAWQEKAKAQAVPEGYVLIPEEAVEKKDRRIEELEYSLKAIYHRAESTYCSACRFAEAEAADVGCGTKTSESGAEG